MRIFKSVLPAMVASVLAMGAVHAQEQKTIDIMAIVEHPSLDSFRQGVLKSLKEQGYEEGKNLKVKYQSAQGNTGTAAQIARQFVGDRPDVIVAIGTPSAQAVVAATKDIPVVFGAVTDPVAAQLVPSKEPSKTNVTGVSDHLPMQAQVDLIKKVVPNAKNVGMVYNPGEANSVVVVKQFKQLLPEQGLTLVQASAPRSVDVMTAARSLVGKVDVIYSSTDNNVVSSYESLLKVGYESKVPLISSDTDSVVRGASAALGVNYESLGEQAGRLVGRIFKGEKPGDMAYQESEHLQLFLNPKSAEKQGLKLSDELIKEATQIVK